MAKCKKCDKFTIWTDNYGYCRKCHDAAFIKTMKKYAGDTTKDVGVLFNGLDVICRCCGKKTTVQQVDKRTGYCLECIEDLPRRYKRKKAQEERETYLNGRQEVEENIHVRGESHYKESFAALRSEDPDYEMSKKEVIEEDLVGQRLYKYYFTPSKVELIDEPTNEYDPNAMAVYIDGLQVGYVPQGSTAHVRKILRSCEVEAIEAQIKGGPFKILYEDDEDSYHWEREDYDFGVVVTIRYLKEKTDA